LRLFDQTGLAGSSPQAFGADIEDAFAKVLKTLDRSFEEQLTYPGSRIDFTLDGKTVDLKGRRLGNWLLADGSLNERAITEFELKNLEESVKHVNATKTSETMLYVLDKAGPDQVKSYKTLLQSIHSGEGAKSLLSKLPSGTRIGLGVTSRTALSRVADVYYTGVFKRVGSSLVRLKKPGKVGAAIGVAVALVAIPAMASEGSEQEGGEASSLEISSFDALRSTIKGEADRKVVEAIIGNARNAMTNAIKDEAGMAKERGVEGGYFVQSNFNPIGLLPVVGNYLDSSNIAAPIVEFPSFMNKLQEGIQTRLQSLQSRLEKIGTPMSSGEMMEMKDALYDAWGVNPAWRKY
jgi:hypothetical protein